MIEPLQTSVYVPYTPCWCVRYLPAVQGGSITWNLA